MEKVRIALVGCGGRGLGHARHLTQSEKLELVAVCDLNEELGRKAAEELGVDLLTDHKDLLAMPDLEAVCVVTATRFHAGVTKDALKAGKHVLCEKPMAENLRDAKEMLEIAETNGLKGVNSYQLHFHPFYMALWENSRGLDPVQVFTSRQIGLMGPKYLTPDDACGLVDFCSHDFDTAIWLMGRAPTAVCATLRRNTYTDTGAIDVLSFQIEFGSGDGVRVASHTASMGGLGIGNKYDIVGVHGNVTAVGMGEVKRNLLVRTPGGRFKAETSVIQVEGPGGDSTAALQDQFADWIRAEISDADAQCTFRDGLNSLAVSAAVLESAKTGQKVTIADLLAKELD